MNLKEARYRVAANNKKCALCGYRIARRLSHDVTAITCLLFGENIEDDHTCNFWKID